MAKVLFHRSFGQQLGGLRSDVHLKTVKRQAAAVLLIHSNQKIEFVPRSISLHLKGDPNSVFFACSPLSFP